MADTGNLIRRLLPFERNFVQLPNGWMRDERLSYAARGILATVMSHEPGWRVTLEGLAKASPQGVDAVRTAVRQLEQHGYLVRRSSRIGKPDNWEICDPSGLYEPALLGIQETREPVDNLHVGKSKGSENPTRYTLENPTTIRTLLRINPVSDVTTESPVDNSVAFGGDSRPAGASAAVCGNGHPIVATSGSGVPFCALGCSQLDVVTA